MRIPFAALSLAAVLAACNGGTPGSSFDPLAYCAHLAAPVLVFPSPSATGVPDGNFALTVSYATNPATFFTQPILISGGALIVTGNTWVAASTTGRWNSTIPGLTGATAYVVTVNDPTCKRVFTLGVFATQ